jgi:hypothetical protein
MPTFIAFKGGDKVDSVVGANPTGLEVCRLFVWPHRRVNDKHTEPD